MIRWKPGLERAPNRKLARQLPEDHVWTSQRWVTKTGDIFRRRWDVHDKTWKWDEAPVPLAFEESTGRVGLYNPSFMSLENVIATAWRRRANRGHIERRIELLGGVGDRVNRRARLADNAQLDGRR